MFDRQSAFDDAVAGLWKQQAVSETETGKCLYRGPNGRRCAVGWLIPDKKYKADLENRTAASALVRDCLDDKYGKPLGKECLFLANMQRHLHDQFNGGMWDATEFKIAVKDFAETHHLTINTNMEL